MLKIVTPAVAILLLVAGSARAQTDYYARLSDLIVTAAAISSQPAHDVDQHYVAVDVHVRYAGTDTACASLSAELRGPNDLAYSEIARSSTDLHWPPPPRISHLARGDESTGTFVFEVKNGSDPLDLVVKLDSPNTACDVPLPDLTATAPPGIHLDLHDLPRPPGPMADSKAAPARAGTHGYGSPACLYCPRADYPKEAMKSKVQGVVSLAVTVTAEGAVSDIHVTQGLGHGLDEAAVAAVSKWRLKPALGPDGQPASVREVIEVTFQLKNFPF